ncbi:MAG: nuclear transport factor 2 family protein [Flammeovirgaceae bacterium]
MKLLIVIIIILSREINIFSNSEEEKVKRVVESFFEAFHSRDSTSLYKLSLTDFELRSSSLLNESQKLSSVSYYDFVKTVSNRDKSSNWEEEILSYEINVDGTLAVAWTPYIFRINDKISHCGSNSFTLHKVEGEWKIIQIIDSRRRDCN